MIYREIREGAELWKSAVSVDGEHWDAIDNSTLDTRLQEAWSTIDEVAEPSLVVHAGAYLLHYSRRRGARWSVGALASHSFLHWRRLDGAAPVLGRSNVGFDSLSVRSPTLVTNTSGLEMVYVATSGEQSQLGFAMREASPVGMFAPRAD